MYVLLMFVSSEDDLTRHKDDNLHTQLDQGIDHTRKQLRIPMQELIMQRIRLQPFKPDINPSINISHHILDLKVFKLGLKPNLNQHPHKLPTRQPPILYTATSNTHNLA